MRTPGGKRMYNVKKYLESKDENKVTIEDSDLSDIPF
jgi:hypothetical protein